MAKEFLRPLLNGRPHRQPGLKDAARARARKLLERALTPEQRRDLSTWGYFYVTGQRFTYRIREGYSGNVEALDRRDCVISRYCAYPRARVPVYDVMLAQKLWIETDEDMFLKEAAPYPL
ncbi:MAG TPA: hypothetical protein VKP68_17935 [Ramlibacter sp.]|nr:hypothetical protein [Ramlibacter sp.]